MISLSNFIPNINELGEGNTKPFNYEPKFKKESSLDQINYILLFKDDDGDIIKLEFGGSEKEWNAEITPTKYLYLPSKSYSMGFAVNNIEVNDYKDDNAKAKKTDLTYYNRLLTTIKNIYFDFIKQFNPNCIFAGKYTSEKKNNQKETRYEIYARLFRNNTPPGYEYFNLENNLAVGFVKSNFRKDIKIEK